ncbi:MAG: hypothetical protein ACTTIO_02915 [Candidatus Fimenecus sp.]
MNSGNKKFFNISSILLFIFIFSSLALRLYQYFTIIDTNYTGFFKKIDWSVPVFSTTLVISCIFFFVLMTRTAYMTASMPVVNKNNKMKLVSMFMAVGILYDIILMLTKLTVAIRGYTRLLEINFFTYLFSEGLIAVILQCICGFLAVIFFILYALSFGDGKNAFFGYRFLALMPLFWTMFRLVYRFMTKIAFIEVSELMLELFALAFMMIFFMSFARMVSSIPQKNDMRKAAAFGIPAALLTAVIGLSRLIATLGGRKELLPNGFVFSLSDLSFAAFAVSFIRFQLCYGRPFSEDESIITEKSEITEQNKTDDSFLSND